MFTFRPMRYVKIIAVILIFSAVFVLCSSGYAMWHFTTESANLKPVSPNVCGYYNDIEENYSLTEDGKLFVKLFTGDIALNEGERYIDHSSADTLVFAKADYTRKSSTVEDFFKDLFADESAVSALESLYDGSIEINTATVYDHVTAKAVAKFKIAHDGETERIITVSGIDYKLEILNNFTLRKHHVFYLKSEA